MTHSFWGQLVYELKSAAFGYPRFVYLNSYVKDIPVFVYHTIDPGLFESHLLYLKNNSYKTLSVHEYVDMLNSNKTDNKSVLLTIDDARSSVWRFAFPLLKKYEMNATVFIIPGITVESDDRRLNLFDVWKGEKSLVEIENIDISDNSLCTWQEISDMYKSGFVNIESHTLFHKEIFKSTKIVDFTTPDKTFMPYNFYASPYLSSSNIGRSLNPDEYRGLPLFESSPLMLAGPRVNISPEFIAKCKEIYKVYISNMDSDDSWKSGNEKCCRRSFQLKKVF